MGRCAKQTENDYKFVAATLVLMSEQKDGGSRMTDPVSPCGVELCRFLLISCCLCVK